MVYSICRRFRTKDHPIYLELRTDCQCEEIVSADCSLFDHEFFWEYDNKRNLLENEQWLAVLAITEGCDIPTLEGFEFCGYDLTDGELENAFGISSLTNCSFDEIFSFKDLNKYGLLDSQKEAERLQKLLAETYFDEQHALCIICAIWRKTKN